MHSDDTDVITALAEDPLYQLSTAGQEQFHTNMLYWLFTRPESAAPLAQFFEILPPQIGIYATRIEREFRHWDLFVDSGMACGKLILENKLHSIPRRDQLEDYYQDALSHFDRTPPKEPVPDEFVYVLLSLIPAGFDLPQPWRHVGYSELLEPLDDAVVELAKSEAEQFHVDLVRNYAQLIRKLVAVRDHYQLRDKQDRPVVLPGSERTRLREARLLPLVEKLRVTELAMLVAEKAGSNDHLGTGLSNTLGLLDFSVPGANGHRFGWQYQGHQVRLAIILDDVHGGPWRGRRADREQLVETQFSDFFDFTSLRNADDMLDPYTGQGLPWLGYEPDFVYRYRPLRKNTTAGQLVELCTELTLHAQRYAAQH